MEKTLTVVVNTYSGDSPKKFERAINSLTQQTFMPDEIIIVIDGPVPTEIDRFIEKCLESNNCFKVVRLENNLGRGLARHAGIVSAQSEFVALMDADDVSLKDRFQKQIELMRTEGLDICGGQIEEFCGEYQSNSNILTRVVPLSHGEILNFAKKRYPFNNVTIMFRADAFKHLNYRSSLRLIEDYDYFAMMFNANWRMGNCPDVLVRVDFCDLDHSRRRGLAYFFEERIVFKKLHRFGLICKKRLYWNLLIRMFGRLFLPHAIFKFFMQNWLRSKVVTISKL